jgi:hypothetical protein
MLLLFFVVKLTQKGIAQSNYFYLIPSLLVIGIFLITSLYTFNVYPLFLWLIIPFLLINLMSYIFFKKIKFISVFIGSYVSLIIFFQAIAYAEATQVFH